MKTRLEEIQYRLKEMKQVPNDSAAYAMAVSDIEWLLEYVEKLQTTIELGNKSEDNKDKIIESLYEDLKKLRLFK